MPKSFLLHLYLQEINFISISSSILSNPIEYLKGVGPQRGELLRKELSIHTFNDLLYHFPFRYVDRSDIHLISDINPDSEYIQVAGKLSGINIIGTKKARRLVATLRDGNDELLLVWFQGIQWAQKLLQENVAYLVYGKITFFNGTPQIAHPEIEPLTKENIAGKPYLEPVYSSTEKLKARGLNGRAISKLTFTLLQQLTKNDLAENIPANILREYKLIPREQAYRQIHFPASENETQQALRRLKFEELFIAQIRIEKIKLRRHQQSHGWMLEKVGTLFNNFFAHHIPFELTNAQKKVIKEIRQDIISGHQMNRLLQGDVGSGKTMVALLTMLLAVDNNFQACLMAPTEILAQQHFEAITEMLKELPVRISLLTGSVKKKSRKEILTSLKNGALHLLIGTHAVIEEEVQFANLGLAIIDEQHRFGVAQRAALWKKNTIAPHILVMTATPIPRTLAMALYGDLDVSIIDELPPGRKPITTVHRTEYRRPEVMKFIKEQIREGRQAYIVYPLIEESEKMDYENLMKGYEEVKAFFPEPAYHISMVHGRQSNEIRSTNMQRFVQGITPILVATTVIEVGVNVPNATIMVIESAEKFGLSQLHQLRGRVGRGADQSYCILMTSNEIKREAKQRVKIMTDTNNGFIIAEKDMELRGPGEMEGTRQSGALNFKLADIIADKNILEAARHCAEKILEQDPSLGLPEHEGLQHFLSLEKSKAAWSKIS